MSFGWHILQHDQIEKARTAIEIASMSVDCLSDRLPDKSMMK